ncbi:MAG: hypothetical protein ACI8P9_000439 [Parasphingorhabdus sp.]|jgi:hypothetical protein
MQSPSLAGVQGIVSSGIGVTLINRGLLTADQCKWPEARQFDEKPSVKFVIRATRLIPQKLLALVKTELEAFLPGLENISGPNGTFLSP